jgi:hypothetical protein
MPDALAHDYSDVRGTAELLVEGSSTAQMLLKQ